MLKTAQILAQFLAHLAQILVSISKSYEVLDIWMPDRIFQTKAPAESIPKEAMNSNAYRKATELKSHVEFLFRENERDKNVERSVSRLQLVVSLCSSGIKMLENEPPLSELLIKFIYNKGVALHMQNQPCHFARAKEAFADVLRRPETSVRLHAFSLNELSIIALKEYDMLNCCDALVLDELHIASDLIVKATDLWKNNPGIFETILDVADRLARANEKDAAARLLKRAGNYSQSIDADGRRMLKKLRDPKNRTALWPSLSRQPSKLRAALPWLFVALLAFTQTLQSAQAGSNVGTRLVAVSSKAKTELWVVARTRATVESTSPASAQ